MPISSITTHTGSSPGPTVTILGATHGDEPGGVRIVERLRNYLHSQLFYGTVNLGIGNPEAYKRRSRSADPDSNTNMNRVFTAKRLLDPQPRSRDVLRAQELAPLLAKTDYLIDLHATSLPSEPFLCFGLNPEKHSPLTRFAPVQRILIDSNHFMGKELGTTDAYVDRSGGIGICYETGQWSNLLQQDKAYKGVLNMLQGVGVIPNGAAVTVPSQQIYTIVAQGKAKSATFTFAPRASHNWAPIKCREYIGSHGHSTAELATHNGVILFQVRKEHIRPNGFLYSIAAPV